MVKAFCVEMEIIILEEVTQHFRVSVLCIIGIWECIMEQNIFNV